MLAIDKVAFTIFGLDVRWYGIIIATGALLAALIATRVARIRGENPDHVWQIFPWVLIGGILGARLGFFVSEPGQFNGDILKALNPLAGGFQGLSIQGALVGGLIAGLLYTRLNKISLLRIMDIAAPGIAVAQGIGRLGNFVNQEAYGTPCAPNEPLCIVIDPENRRKGYEQYSTFHPTFAYEMIVNFLNAALCYWLNKPAQQQRFGLCDGDVFWIYAIIYSIGRFIIEAIRVDSAMAGDIKVPQLFAVITIVVAFAIIAYNHRTRPASTPALAGAGANTVLTNTGMSPEDEAAAEEIAEEEDMTGTPDAAETDNAIEAEMVAEQEQAAAAASGLAPSPLAATAAEVMAEEATAAPASEPPPDAAHRLG